MNFSLPSKSLQQIVALLATFPEIEKAVVFGSRAMGNYKPGSDVDIALNGHKITLPG